MTYNYCRDCYWFRIIPHLVPSESSTPFNAYECWHNPPDAEGRRSVVNDHDPACAYYRAQARCEPCFYWLRENQACSLHIPQVDAAGCKSRFVEIRNAGGHDASEAR